MGAHVGSNDAGAVDTEVASGHGDPVGAGDGTVHPLAATATVAPYPRAGREHTPSM